MRRLTVSPGYGPKFLSLRTIRALMVNGLWVPDSKSTYSRSITDGRPCDSILATQQLVPLSKYGINNYVETDNIDQYIQDSSNDHPNQVKFFESSRDVSRQEAQEMFGDKWRDHVNEMLWNQRNEEPNTVPLITATIQSVSGQILNPNTGAVEAHKVPWQRVPNRVELGNSFDRKKYPIIFEWGRLSQELAGEAEDLMSILTAMNVSEVIALGAEIKDAYVFLHALSPLNTRFFNSLYPGTIFPKGWKNKNDSLFLVPLSKMIEIYPPSRQSGTYAKFHELTARKLSEVSAIEFMFEFDRIRFKLLDPMVGGRPLAVHDMSIAAAYQRVALLEKFGLDDSSNELTKFLMARFSTDPMYNQGQFQDLSDVSVTQNFYSEKNAIEISNLEVSLIQNVPLYIEKILTSVLLNTLKQMTHDPLNKIHKDNLLRFLIEKDVKIGITTFNSIIKERVQSLNPSIQQIFNYESEFSAGPSDFPGQEWIGAGYKNPGTALLFSIEQILELDRANPQLKEASINAYRENIWTRLLHVSNPDFY